MLVNHYFEEIFIVSETTREIHAASKLTPSCNIVLGKKDVIPAKDAKEVLADMLVRNPGLDFCGHCFPDLSKR